MSLDQTVEGAEKIGIQAGELRERDIDEVLVARVREGDYTAYDALMKKYRERLFAVVYNMTSNREDARDLVQEAFIKAFQSIHRFQGKSAFFTWLYRIAVNATLSHLRRHRFRRFFSLETLPEEVSERDCLEFLSVENKVEKPVLLRELQLKLNAALQRLSPKHRTVVILFEIENLSHDEIAEVMGCSVGTVRSRLFYARKVLQGLLSEYLTP